MVSLGDAHWGNLNKFANLHKFLKMARVQRVKEDKSFYCAHKLPVIT
jgi:hypothetical protein